MCDVPLTLGQAEMHHFRGDIGIFFWFKVNSFLTNHHNSRAYDILFTWIKVITLFDYCGIDIQPVKFGTPNAPQFDIDPHTYTTSGPLTPSRPRDAKPMIVPPTMHTNIGIN